MTELRLLLVEDSQADAVLIQRSMASADWTHVLGIDEARDKLAIERFHAVITDLHLGATRGTDTVRALRGFVPDDVPIMALSGTVTDEIVHPLIEAGADQVLDKDSMRRLSQGIRQAVAQRQRLRASALLDEMTGLPNRRALPGKFRQSQLRTARRGEKLALLFFDIDRFKSINDAHGHAVGDLAIRSVAARVRPALREIDILGRLHGDEFVIIAEGVRGPRDATRLGERIIESVRARPIELGTSRVTISISVGIALYPEHGESFESLCQVADDVMYVSKKAGGGRVSVAE